MKTLYVHSLEKWDKIDRKKNISRPQYYTFLTNYGMGFAIEDILRCHGNGEVVRMYNFLKIDMAT